MKSKRFRANNKKEYLMDLTPLIDVVFLLLIFFMVATTFSEFSSMELELPQTTNTKKSSEEVEYVRVVVDKYSSILIMTKIGGEENKVEVEKLYLKDRLAEVLTGIDDKGVSLVAHQNLDYGMIVGLIELIKEAGASGLKIETEQKEWGYV